MDLVRELAIRGQPYGLLAIKLTRDIYDVVFRYSERWREQHDMSMLKYEPLFLYAGGKDIRLVPDCERLELVF